MSSAPIRVAITGAAGQIGYALVFRIASGQLLGPDQPVILQMLEITPALDARNGVAMELNAHPERLDLKDTHLIQAREMGVKLVISTDAHKPAGLDLMHYGIEQAQRAWLTPDDVLNTLPLETFLKRIDRDWKKS